MDSRHSTLRSTTDQETMSRRGSIRPPLPPPPQVTTRKSTTSESSSRYKNYNCSRRPGKLKANSHRKGPIPIEECRISTKGEHKIKLLFLHLFYFHAFNFCSSPKFNFCSPLISAHHIHFAPLFFFFTP